MKNDNVGLGIFLVVVGVIIILINIGVMDWTILYSFLRLWPLLLVMAGLNIIFKDNRIVKLIMWLLLIAALVGYGYYLQTNPGFDVNIPRGFGSLTVQVQGGIPCGSISL